MWLTNSAGVIPPKVSSALTRLRTSVINSSTVRLAILVALRTLKSVKVALNSSVVKPSNNSESTALPVKGKYLVSLLSIVALL